MQPVITVAIASNPHELRTGNLFDLKICKALRIDPNAGLFASLTTSAEPDDKTVIRQWPACYWGTGFGLVSRRALLLIGKPSLCVCSWSRTRERWLRSLLPAWPSRASPRTYATLAMKV